MFCSHFHKSPPPPPPPPPPRPTNGWLFLTSGAAIEVAAGAAVDFGGRQWATRLVGANSLQLSIMSTTDDGRQRVADRMEGVAHEVAKRMEDVEALKARRMKLTADMEQVLELACWLFACRLAPCADRSFLVVRAVRGSK